MPLAAGSRLGPSEIAAPLGAGGMGEVYRARDTRLDRSVAIKVLSPEIAADPTLRSRFEREARAVAALDHPHICGIYDVGEAEGTHFLVMPCLEGQTLAARLQNGALPMAEALTIAREIADALDKAHRQGIVHCDLKPANIMLTKAGSKLLDFGLAKLRTPGGAISLTSMEQLATAPPGTAHGTILGTVQYMSPEQVDGREVDSRADIWALGAVLYEMLTGTRPFTGDTPASIIGSILKDQPDAVSARLPHVPRPVDHLVEMCLAKDPDRRVYPPPGLAFTGSAASVPVPQLTVSPDGRHLVFVAGRPQQKPSLWLRTLSEREPRELPDTVDADVPFWSPDSRTIAFFSHGILKKRDIAGTAPSQFAGKATVDVRGGAWSQTGTIVFAPAGNIGLFKLAGAGAAERLNLQDAAGPFYTARWPEFVPGHDQFVFQLRDPADVARKGLYLGADSTSPSHAASWTGTLPRSTRRT